MSRYKDTMTRASLADQLRRNALHFGDRQAVVSYDLNSNRSVMTYLELDNYSDKVASALSQAGMEIGDRICAIAKNSLDYVALWYGALKVGMPLSGVNPLLTPLDIEDHFASLRPRVLFVDRVFLEKYEGVIKDAHSIELVVIADRDGDYKGKLKRTQKLVDLSHFDTMAPFVPNREAGEDDIAMIVLTSGTEAKPKGVMLSNRNYLIATIPSWSIDLSLTRDDRWLFVMPFFTMAGIGTMTTLTQVGATVVLPATIDPDRAIALILSEKITIMAQTPTFYLAMSKSLNFTNATVSTLARAITYGGLVPKAMLDAWSAVHPKILWGTYWSQSELAQVGTSGWFHTMEEIPDRDPSWIGRAMPALEIRIVDPDGNDTNVGEAIARSPGITSGYFNDIDRSEKLFGDGWLHTGDVMRIDSSGNLFFVDRLKDVIKTGGFNVSSVEVERVISQHHAIERVAVVGVPDPYWSEAITAFVVLRDNVACEVDEILAFARERLASFKVPKSIRIVDLLPTDSQGKVLKRVLRSL
ncbi:class I adenylate-forming enzyme family protein [Acidithrix sp. C25]|uniref:class I adenylate-forming enzyme family protein n=1 Tax=Acidithrix sp. C25 TaxID=1671482 RepID=UPI00191B94B1|nr:class I adenylate-forming enzyme family protein [Acidithrix sp. C25]